MTPFWCTKLALYSAKVACMSLKGTFFSWHRRRFPVRSFKSEGKFWIFQDWMTDSQIWIEPLFWICRRHRHHHGLSLTLLTLRFFSFGVGKKVTLENSSIVLFSGIFYHRDNCWQHSITVMPDFLLLSPDEQKICHGKRNVFELADTKPRNFRLVWWIKPRFMPFNFSD